MCVKMHVRLLTLLGAECSVAYDGQEAVQAVDAAMQLDNALAAGEARAGFDLVLMDNCMPVMEGPAACGALRAMGCTCLIVGLTGACLCVCFLGLVPSTCISLFKLLILSLFSSLVSLFSRLCSLLAA